LAESRQPKKEGSRVVREGETFEVEKIIVKVVEVAPHFDAFGSPSYMVGIRLIDGAFQSDVFHFWMKKREDPRPHVEKVVHQYLHTHRSILGIKT